VRKIFDVEFLSFHQTYESSLSKLKEELSIITVYFDIKNFHIQQDSDLITLESFIRDRKLDKLIE
jgi:hypothetical protein